MKFLKHTGVANVVRVRGGSVEHRHVRYEDNDPLACCEHDVADGGETWASATCGWAHSDLSPAAKSTATFGYPFAYIRNDRVSSIIYRGSDDHELALPAERWSWGRKSLSLSSELAGIS